jgi:hypothetical protein
VKEGDEYEVILKLNNEENEEFYEKKYSRERGIISK